MTSPSSSPPVTAPPDAFRFGKNWQRYVSGYLDPDRERIAAESLADLVGDLRGKGFIDIGCGSGLFSLCAYRAGAREVLSFDVDPDSVEATLRLHRREGGPSNWKVLHGSILDEALVAGLEPADVVYSWGVLHHTGDMFTALRHAAGLVKPGGLLAIAIYNRITGRWLDSAKWWQIKRRYNHSSRPAQRTLEVAYALYWLAGQLRDRQNPLRTAREYRRSRGMALWTDMIDWLGGYPYEFAAPHEIVEFCECCDLQSVKVNPVAPRDSGNNEFVFRRIRPRETVF